MTARSRFGPSGTRAASAVRFSYDAAFRETAIEPAPLMMPVGQRTFEFPELPYRSFHGLPGLLKE